MSLSAEDTKRAKHILNRSIIRDECVKRFSTFYALVREVTHDSNDTPIALVRKRNIESLLPDFRMNQSEILNQLIVLDRTSECITDHTHIGTQVLEQYY